MFLNFFSSSAIAVVVIALSICYLYVQYVYSYWKRRGIPYLRPSFPFGNFVKNDVRRIPLGEQIDKLYRSTTEPFIGVYVALRPTLIIRDTSLIQNVLIKDFQYFVDRGIYYDEANDPLSAHLVAIDGDRWKNLRAKLTPSFTSGKMRAIFSTLLNCKHPLQKYIRQVAQTDESVEVREMTACYSSNVIASVAFGIDIDCLADPNIPFRLYGRKIFELTLKNAFRYVCYTICPPLLKWTKLGVIDRDVEQFFFNLTEQTLKLREKNNIVRKDIFQLLVKLRNGGNMQQDNEWETIIANDNSKKMSMNEMAANVYVFYMAGYETSSATMTFCLFEIARTPDIQRKVHEEIDRVLAQHDGELTYDSINELKFLECCIDETLRKYSAIQFLNRVCTKDYKIPGSNVTIEKGTAILIPSFSLHRDEKFYLDPLKFDPSRFDSKNKNGKTIIDMPFLPFGDGPRNCIGMRLAKMSMKVGLVSILQQHSIDIDERHVGKEIKLSAGAIILVPTNGAYLKFKARYPNA